MSTPSSLEKNVYLFISGPFGNCQSVVLGKKTSSFVCPVHHPTLLPNHLSSFFKDAQLLAPSGFWWWPAEAGRERQTRTRAWISMVSSILSLPITAPNLLELVKNDKNLWHNLLSTGRKTLQDYSDLPQLVAMFSVKGAEDPRGLKIF